MGGHERPGGSKDDRAGRIDRPRLAAIKPQRDKLFESEFLRPGLFFSLEQVFPRIRVELHKPRCERRDVLIVGR